MYGAYLTLLCVEPRRSQTYVLDLKILIFGPSAILKSLSTLFLPSLCAITVIYMRRQIFAIFIVRTMYEVSSVEFTLLSSWLHRASIISNVLLSN